MENMDLEKLRFGTELIKRGFAKMQKGGVIMDVTNAEQAKIAEEAGAVAVMAKCRIGHIIEAKALEALGVDMVDESEVLTPADTFFHINKKKFIVPFVCGARSLGEACRRIWEGAAMIRTKGEAGTGNVVEAVKHMRLMNFAIEKVKKMDDTELNEVAISYALPYKRLAESVSNEGIKLKDDDLIYEEYTFEDIVKGLYEVLQEVKKMGRLPVVNFAAGGIATPADAAFMMHLGADGVFVGSGIFKSSNPPEYARAIVEATENWRDASIVAKVSKGLGEAMKGQEIEKLAEQLQTRGL